MVLVQNSTAKTYSYIDILKTKGVFLSEIKDPYSWDLTVNKEANYIIILAYLDSVLLGQFPVVLIHTAVKNYRNLFVFPVTSIFKDFADCHRWLQTLTPKEFVEFIKNHVSKFLKVF